MVGERVQEPDFNDLQARDEELRVEVERLLCSSGYAELRNVKVSLAEGHVVLRGQVTTYYLKQMAHSAIRMADGIRSVDDELVVC